jgi:predicted metal-binding transcription factor (methanogenesis marker protein 9)
MSDDKSKVGKADRDRVSLSEEYEVTDLAQKFGITAEQAREAIKSAGPMRKDIEAYLQRAKTAKTA